MAKAEGENFHFEDTSKIDPNYLEIFDFDSPNQYFNDFSSTHFLPDIAKVKIEYFPTGGKCVELKSLKYYFTSFRNVGIYQEAVTKRIYDDLSSILKTKKMQVTTIYNIRGGFKTVCVEGSIKE